MPYRYANMIGGRICTNKIFNTKDFLLMKITVTEKSYQ